MRQQLDSLALALPLLLGYYTRVFLAHFLLDVYSALASRRPDPSISLGLTASNSTSGHICPF